MATRWRFAKRPKPRAAVADEAFRTILDAYEQAAQRLWPGIDKALREAIDDATLAKLVEAFENASIAGIEATVDWATLGANLAKAMTPGLRAALEEGGKLALAQMPGRVTYGFEVLDPYVITYMDTHLPKLVREVTATSRQAIRTAVRAAYRDGVGPRAAAKMIQGSVGLTEKQALAVANFRSGVIRAAEKDYGVDYLHERWSASRDVVRTNRQITLANADALAGQYQRRLVVGRSLTIARHEAVVAVSQGRLDFWTHAMQTGALNRDTDYQEWITTAGACKICAPLDGKRAKIGGSFGGGVYKPGDTHPQCRCDVRIVLGKR